MFSPSCTPENTNPSNSTHHLLFALSAAIVVVVAILSTAISFIVDNAFSDVFFTLIVGLFYTYLMLRTYKLVDDGRSKIQRDITPETVENADSNDDLPAAKVLFGMTGLPPAPEVIPEEYFILYTNDRYDHMAPCHIITLIATHQDWTSTAR